MSETVDRKELKGIGGWLVLFQIYIIMSAFSAAQSLLTLFVMNRNIVLPAFKPYYIVLLAAAFALVLVCVVLFYKKRMAFRPVFIVYSIVVLATTTVYLFYGSDFSYYSIELGEYASFFTSVIKSIGYVSLAIGTGIIVAFIIALYKSQRVKNTFINS